MITTLPATITTISGVQITELGLVSDALDDQINPEIDAVVAKWERAINWLRGDLAARYLRQSTQRSKIKARDERHARQLELEHIATYADLYELNRDKVAEAEEVARFFPFEMRRKELTFQHHLEAMIGSKGQVDAAAELLDLCIANAWTVSELRAYIRKQHAERPEEPSEPPEPGLDRKVGELELWASKRLRDAQTMPPASARALLLQMRRTVELVETLTRRASESKGIYSN